MNDDFLFAFAAVLGLTTIATVPLSETPDLPVDEPLVPLVRVKDEDASPVIELKEDAEIDADSPKRDRKRGPISTVGCCCGEALYKAVILLLAVAILAGLKFAACKCGLQLH